MVSSCSNPPPHQLLTTSLVLPRAVASTHIIALPLYASLLPIVAPTLYLWLLDSVALRRGTWVIENGTKLGYAVYGLEIE